MDRSTICGGCSPAQQKSREPLGIEFVETAAPPPPAADILARVDTAMKQMPADEIGDPAEFRRALMPAVS